MSGGLANWWNTAGRPGAAGFGAGGKGLLAGGGEGSKRFLGARGVCLRARGGRARGGVCAGVIGRDRVCVHVRVVRPRDTGVRIRGGRRREPWKWRRGRRLDRRRRTGGERDAPRGFPGEGRIGRVRRTVGRAAEEGVQALRGSGLTRGSLGRRRAASSRRRCGRRPTCSRRAIARSRSLSRSAGWLRSLSLLWGGLTPSAPPSAGTSAAAAMRRRTEYPQRESNSRYEIENLAC